MNKQFEGRLRAKNPKDLVSIKGKEDIDDFFLALALVFNDLKGIILFQKLLNETYVKPGSRITVHDGEFGGLNIQIVRIFSGMINEFLEMIRDNPVTKSEKFNKMLDNLKAEQRNLWKDLISISHKERVQENVLNYALMRIRGNITFHYKDAGRNLRRGFQSRFYEKEKNKLLKNDAAYYSLEDTLGKTRFYYADAAAEEYMIQISKDWPAYMNDIKNLIQAMHSAIFYLIKDYLKVKGNDLKLKLYP